MGRYIHASVVCNIWYILALPLALATVTEGGEATDNLPSPKTGTTPKELQNVKARSSQPVSPGLTEYYQTYYTI